MDRIIDAIARANWTVLLTIVIGLIIWVIAEMYKKNKLSKQMDNLSLKFLEKQEELEKKLASSITLRHNNLGSSVSGNYKNLGSQISTEHKHIKSDTKNVYEMMLLEKQNREKLYENTSRAKEILDTMDLMKEVVDKTASLKQEVAVLKLENTNLLNDKAKDNSENLIKAIRQFEDKLAGFEDFRETGEIIGTLKKIEQQLSKYLD